ncbi:MAG: EI24 domain-containing protein [Opitutales bacterium]
MSGPSAEAVGVWSVFRDAHRVIWDRGCWKYLLAPVLLCALSVAALSAAVWWAAGSLSDSVVAFLFSSPSALSVWAGRFVFVLLLMLGALVGTLSSRLLVAACYAPFLGLLGEAAEAELEGVSVVVSPPWLASLVRAIGLGLASAAVSLALLVLGLLLSLIPLAGPVLSVVVVFPLQCVLLTAGYLDPHVERRGGPVTETFALALRRFGTSFAFGALGTALTIVPVAGWILGPTYCVVGGMALGLRFRRAGA